MDNIMQALKLIEDFAALTARLQEAEDAKTGIELSLSEIGTLGDVLETYNFMLKSQG